MNTEENKNKIINKWMDNNMNHEIMEMPSRCHENLYAMFMDDETPPCDSEEELLEILDCYANAIVEIEEEERRKRDSKKIKLNSSYGKKCI